MEEIWGFIALVLFVIFVVIPLIIEYFVQILTFIVSIIVVLYLLFSLYLSVRIYFDELINNISLEKFKGTNSTKEPSVKKYFFEKAFIDLKYILKKSIQSYKIEDFLRIGGYLFLSLFALLHLVLISFSFLILYGIRLIVYSLDRAYFVIRKFSAACPYCHTKTMVPSYVCDNCKVIHKKLYPNEYGFFYHKCQCGTRLPSVFFLGRKKLKAKCSNCNNLLSEEFIEARKIFIPIIGGASVGKTNFMFSIVRNLIEKDEYRKGFQANFSDNNTKAKYEKTIKDIKNNFLPQKTATYLPKAFNIVLTQAKKTTWTFYLYDAAGEAFRDMDRLNIQKYTEYSSGIVFIIDPFSLKKVRNKYKKKLNTVAASQDSIDDILSRLLSSLEHTVGLKKMEKYKKPFAIIFNKTDELDNEIINNDAKKGAEQLKEWGEERFLQKIALRFENVKFFKISAMQSLKNTQNDIMEPIMWIAENEGFGKE